MSGGRIPHLRGGLLPAVLRVAIVTSLVSLPLIAALATDASATTDSVTNCANSGSGSLRQAVEDASAGDVINFALSPLAPPLMTTPARF